MKTQRFWALVKKEFVGFLNTPLAYLVLIPFLIVNAFLFFRSALVMSDANLRPMMEMLPWFFIVLAPALTMKSFSEEYKRDTLELLFAHPVTEWQIVLSKFFGVGLFYSLLLILTLPIAVTVRVFGGIDIGLMVGQYVGAYLLGLLFMAVGLWASVMVKNSIGGFLIGAFLCMALLFAGMQFVVLMIPAPFNKFVTEATVLSHVTNTARGVIDIRDLSYFLIFTFILLAATVLKLSERKFLEMSVEKSKLTLIIALSVVAGVLTQWWFYDLPIRIDITADRRFSISSGVKTLLKDLPDRVNVTLIASNNLPGPMQVTLRDTTDLLKDFKRYGNKLVINNEVGEVSKIKADAIKKGVKEVQFNQIGGNSFSVQTGFLGLVINYGEKTEVIEFIEDASQLEYRLSRLIAKITRDERPKLGIMEVGETTGYETLVTLLSDQYEIVRISEENTEVAWDRLVGVVVIDDGSNENAKLAGLLQNYISNRGKLLVFADGVNISQDTLATSTSKSKIPDLFNSFGVTLNKDLVYDLQLNEPITLGSGGMRYILPYPFWMRALINKNQIPWGGVSSNVLVGWASSLKVIPTEGITIKTILESSLTSGIQETGFTIRPEQLQGGLAPMNKKNLVGVLVLKGEQRLALFGDTQIVADDFLKNLGENQEMVVNAVDYIAADPILSSIPQKTGGRMVFKFGSISQAQMVQYANIFAPSVVVFLAGWWWLVRRRKLAERKYEK